MKNVWQNDSVGFDIKWGNTVQINQTKDVQVKWQFVLQIDIWGLYENFVTSVYESAVWSWNQGWHCCGFGS